MTVSTVDALFGNVREWTEERRYPKVNADGHEATVYMQALPANQP